MLRRKAKKRRNEAQMHGEKTLKPNQQEDFNDHGKRLGRYKNLNKYAD